MTNLKPKLFCLFFLFGIPFMTNAQFNERHYKNAPTNFHKARSERDKVYSIYKWGERLLKEFPDITIKELRTTRKLNRRTIMLLLDDNFAPVFGAPYDQLNKKFQTELKSFYARKKQNQNILKWETSILRFAYYEQKRSFFSRQFERTRAERKEFKNMLAALEKGNLSFDELIQFKNKSDHFSDSAWPSEIASLKKQIQRSIESVIQEELAKWADEIAGLSSTYNDFRIVESFQHSPLYKNAPNHLQEKYRQIAENKMDEILIELVAQGKKVTLANFSFTWLNETTAQNIVTPNLQPLTVNT